MLAHSHLASSTQLIYVRFATKRKVMQLSYLVAITLPVSIVPRGVHAVLCVDLLLMISLSYTSNEDDCLIQYQLISNA